MQVGAADAAGCDLHQDLVGGRLGQRPLAHDERPARLLEHHRAHDHCSCGNRKPLMRPHHRAANAV